jgi:hypothetical protein
VNFVGHAIVARWEDADPRHGAGAMLPDLARMCGAPTPSTHDEIVLAGVRCHHRVDAAFHDSPQFLALMRDARRDLLERGVPRAASLAAAHVGVELLLDGAWLSAPTLAPAFHAAASGARRIADTALAWPDAETHARFVVLCERLPEIAEGYASAEIVGERVVRILARRPRLDPGSAAPAISAWAKGAARQVASTAAGLLDELQRAMGARP